MKAEKITLFHIPAIIWGEPSDKVYIHVNGKGGCKEDAAHFAAIAREKGYQTISFDLPEHGERTDNERRLDVWNGTADLDIVANYAFEHYAQVSLYACSLGAYFALNCCGERKFKKCLFQSPIVNMLWLVSRMMEWFDVTPERLEREKEINTPIDPLRWDYYQHILSHPVENWSHHTAILYGGRDELQSRLIIETFARRFGCELTISARSDHPFMQPGDGEIVEKWLRDNI